MPATAAVATVSITDLGALDKAVEKYATNVIDVVTDKAPGGRIREEFKFPGQVNATDTAFYVDGTDRDDNGFLTVKARATVLSSPFYATVHYIVLTRSTKGWHARLEASGQVSRN